MEPMVESNPSKIRHETRKNMKQIREDSKHSDYEEEEL